MARPYMLLDLEVGLACGQYPNLVGCQFGKMPGTMTEYNMTVTATVSTVCDTK